jgi:hypothetical protein
MKFDQATGLWGGLLVPRGWKSPISASRRKFGKPVTDDELFQAIRIGGELKIDTQFFCIGGVDTPEEWLDLLSRIPVDHRFQPRVFFKFTNMEYQMFTPIYQYRHQFDLKRYLDKRWRDRFFAEARSINKRVRIISIGSPAIALWRMGTSLSTTLEQYALFRKLRSSRDVGRVHGALIRTKALDVDYSDEVVLPYKWKRAGHENAEIEADEGDRR